MNAVAEPLTNAITASAQLHDIRGPVGIPGEWLWLWVFLAVMVVGAALAVIFRSFKKTKTVSLDPVKPAWETALEAVLNLEKSGYVQKGLVKEYYSELSGIVRWYIEQRFDVHAPEMTTEEFMQVIRTSDKLSSAQQGFLKDFLNASDMVKFAKFIPSPEEMFNALRLARMFIEEAR